MALVVSFVLLVLVVSNVVVVVIVVDVGVIGVGGVVGGVVEWTLPSGGCTHGLQRSQSILVGLPGLWSALGSRRFGPV